MMMKRLFSSAATFGLTLSLLAGLPPGVANAETWQPDMARLTVLPGWTRADGSRVAGLQIDLEDGWKTYWRAPGDAGIPPQFDLSDSDNLAVISPQWPTPDVFTQNGMTSVGYESSLILPVILTPQSPGQAIRLQGRLMIGVCKDVCVPAELPMSLDLPADHSTRDTRISSAMADQPMPAQKAGLQRANCKLRPTEDGMAFQAELQLPAVGSAEHVVVETADPLIWVAEAETTRDGNTLHVSTEMMHVEGEAMAIDRSSLRITVLGDRQAVDIQGCSAG